MTHSIWLDEWWEMGWKSRLRLGPVKLMLLVTHSCPPDLPLCPSLLAPASLWELSLVAHSTLKVAPFPYLSSCQPMTDWNWYINTPVPLPLGSYSLLDICLTLISQRSPTGLSSISQSDNLTDNTPLMATFPSHFPISYWCLLRWFPIYVIFTQTLIKRGLFRGNSI